MSLLAVFIRQDFVFLRSVIFWVVCATGFEVFNLGDLWQSWQLWQSSPIPVYQWSLIFFLDQRRKVLAFALLRVSAICAICGERVRSFQSRRFWQSWQFWQSSPTRSTASCFPPITRFFWLPGVFNY
jgi:hypothetical protein